MFDRDGLSRVANSVAGLGPMSAQTMGGYLGGVDRRPIARHVKRLVDWLLLMGDARAVHGELQCDLALVVGSPRDHCHLRESVNNFVFLFARLFMFTTAPFSF